MIVDVHTHAPRWKTPPAQTDKLLNSMWRPDQTQSTAHTWDEYLAALKPVDRAIVFNIASHPNEPEPDDGQLIYPAARVNDDTAAIVRAHPEKLIGFLSVNPH